jgi:hypothetical protein
VDFDGSVVVSGRPEYKPTLIAGADVIDDEVADAAVAKCLDGLGL